MEKVADPRPGIPDSRTNWIGLLVGCDPGHWLKRRRCYCPKQRQNWVRLLNSDSFN